MQDLRQKPLPKRLGFIIALLVRAVAGRNAFDRSAGPLHILIVGRLRRLQLRFLALFARVQAGTLLLRPPRPQPPRSRDPDLSPPERPAEKPELRLPRKFGWLVHGLTPFAESYRCEAAGCRAGVLSLLEDPQMLALIQTAPQAGRILRPLCHMLGIKPPPILKLPPRPGRPRKPKTAAPAALARVEKPREKPITRRPNLAIPPGPGLVWKKWRGLWMSEPDRSAWPTPAPAGKLKPT